MALGAIYGSAIRWQNSDARCSLSQPGRRKRAGQASHMAAGDAWALRRAVSARRRGRPGKQQHPTWRSTRGGLHKLRLSERRGLQLLIDFLHAPAFEQLLDMTALTLDYFVNRRFVGMHKCQGVWAYMHVLRGCYAWLTSAYGATPARISSDLPPRPLYPAVGSHRLAKGGTCFAAAFNVPFSLSDDGKTLLYKNLH